MENILKATALLRKAKRHSKTTQMNFQFREQIAEDISLIQKNWMHLDNDLRSKDYAFNYWILNRIYDIDEEMIPDIITEYNDKAIDCYVHYPESKELYIIQNKYYDENTPLDRKHLTDFLNTPIRNLNENTYTRSKEFQKLFNEIKQDSEYKIFLHFYLSNNKKVSELISAIKDFNNNLPVKISPLLRAEIFFLDDIHDKYYGESYKENISFKFTLNTKVRGNRLRILPVEYDLPEMSEAHYMLTPVSQLYFMYKESKERKYPLFEENIREYLGKSIINKGIIDTLKDKKDRSNFFYYNNGVTIICEAVAPLSKTSIQLTKPQIINGCQTVNSIYEVLSDYTDQQIKDEFTQVFVMVKILLFDSKTRDIKPNFYRDIVKYTNKQNSINENAFGAKAKYFSKIQNELKERGFLLLVKPSDKNIFISSYSSDAEINILLKRANDFSGKIGIQFNKVSDLFIPLEKLLQVYLAFIKDGFYSFTKKDAVLKPTSEIYKDFSLKITKYLSHDNLIRLYLIYLKAEKNRSESDDKKTPIPYYLIGFLGKFIKNKDLTNSTLNNLFESQNSIFNTLFDYLEKLTNRYKKDFIETTKTEYNVMIKRPIDDKIVDKQIEILNDVLTDRNLKKFFDSLL